MSQRGSIAGIPRSEFQSSGAKPLGEEGRPTEAFMGQEGRCRVETVSPMVEIFASCIEGEVKGRGEKESFDQHVDRKRVPPKAHPRRDLEPRPPFDLIKRAHPFCSSLPSEIEERYQPLSSRPPPKDEKLQIYAHLY